MSRKSVMLFISVFAASLCIAAPHRPGRALRHSAPPIVRHVQAPRPPAMPHSVHHSSHHSHSLWGRGGSNFWPGFVGGLVGSTIVRQPYAVMLPPPPRPMVYIQQTWVPPVYENRPIYDAYGNIIGYTKVLISHGYWTR